MKSWRLTRVQQTLTLTVFLYWHAVHGHVLVSVIPFTTGTTRGCVQVRNLNPSHSFGEETTRPVTSVWTLSQYSSHHRAAAATGGATQPVIESEVTHLNSFNCSLTQRLNFPDPPLIVTSDCPNRRVTDTHSDADECVLAWLSAPDIVTQTRVPTLSSLPFKLRCQSPQTSSATGATTFN